MIAGNLDQMKSFEEKKSTTDRMQELRDKYNALVKEKSEVQSQLLQSEEEKLSMSKGIIELQIENSKLQEHMQNLRFESDSNGLHQEADAKDMDLRLEKAQKTIMDLQESLGQAVAEKKEFEVEFMSVKRNYLNKCKELDEQRRKNEQIGLELINVINENRALSKDSTTLGQKHSMVGNECDKQLKRANVTEAENARLKEELMRVSAELEHANNDKIKAEVTLEQMRLDYDKKRVALEKEYVNMTKYKEGQLSTVKRTEQEETKARRSDKELWENEKIDFHRKYKELNRKLETSQAEILELREFSEELKTDKNNMGVQLDELRNAYRTKLGKATGEEARAEIVNSYVTKERQLEADVVTLKERIEKLRGKCRGLREYARQLKFLADDLLPEGQMRPDILEAQEPDTIPEEKGAAQTNAGTKEGLYVGEITKLRDENTQLRVANEQAAAKIKRLKETRPQGGADGDIQRKILDELKMLKESPKQGVRPASGRAEEYERMRKERNDALEEARKLKQIVLATLITRTI